MSKRWIRGSAALFALVCLLSSGAFRLGYALSAYQTVVDNVERAAREASHLEFDARNPAAFSRSVQNLVVYGSTGSRRNRIVEELTPADVQVTWTADASGRPARITVSVSGASGGSLLQAVLLTHAPEASVPYAG